MKEYSIFSILTILLVNTSEASEYSIKLASYSNKVNLIKQVSKLDDNLEKEIYITKNENLYKAFSISFTDKSSAIQKLQLYRNIFPDAYITTQIPKNRIENISSFKKVELFSEQNITDSISIKKSHKTMVPTTESPLPLSLDTLLKGKTFYLCPDSIYSNAEKLLIEADFQENNMVIYKTVSGKIPSMEIGYIIQRNKIYFSRNGMINPSQYSKIDETLFEYYIISKWSRGKKIHRMRYYKKQADAKSYLDSFIF